MQLLSDHKLNDSDMSWMKYAKCKGRDDIPWFPEPGEAHLVVVAKKFCIGCSTQKRCLQWALDNEIPYGVWGGKSSSERKRLYL